ncbi:MAG TPA: prephenate dehydrogenase/arogenate dehydrogenase family protein [Solirubrobacter sp.]|nr:prephenate dehydrogenase/arogenate dehydrogenase family protein [Solirubrobacter sp.]
MKVAVAGVGLIGGSIGLAAHQRLGAHVSGYDPSPAARDAALERGAVAEVHDSIPAAVAGADIVFVAAPVQTLAATVREALDSSPEPCVVTDVGSVKRAVAGAIDDPRFIGGHPLAGAETSGVEHARPDLFQDATWYLTPTAATRGTAYEQLHRVITRLGAWPSAIEPDAHDVLMASVSHLPHVLANVLVAQTARVLSAEGERLPATGPSFRDLTRVAGANTVIWGGIYRANADALVAAIDDLVTRLTSVRDGLTGGDDAAIAAWNDAARDDRRRLLESDLAGGEVRELRVLVPNRPGSVAEIALALGRATIDIVDMSLYPSGSSGTVALWIRSGVLAEAERLVRGLGLEVVRA